MICLTNGFRVSASMPAPWRKMTLHGVWLTNLKPFQPQSVFSAIGCVSSLKTYSPARYSPRGFFSRLRSVVEGLNEAVEWATEAPDGWVAEWFKAAVLKTAVGASSP